MLFNTGSSLFISTYTFVVNFGLEPVYSETFLQFETVTGTHMLAKCICYKCSIFVNDKLLEWDLIALEISDFGLILGMAWLAAITIIECDLRRITLSLEMRMSV